MSSPASPTFFISGINHCELRPGQLLTLDHLRSLQQQLAEQAGRARAIQQQLQQQAAQQGLRAVASTGAAVKAEPGAAGAKKEEDGAQQATTQQTQQQLQYAALLALQLQQQQARAAAAAAQAQQQQARPAGAPTATAAFAGGPAALAQNVFPQQGGRHGASAGAPAGLPHHAAAGGGGRGRGAQRQSAAARQSKAAAEEPATDQWVQCSKCQQWRQVPDEFWPDIENADEDEDWTCKDALWDVEDYEPNTPACC
ncbi:hypothetical protein PLESTF_000601400 [Pleodorina starrii]|nr:hypothetical protein PLESTM_001774500 [Pleodorina starrii]GLC67748.1 hypothetical protein PLESTF_000601400 [Pleodorina starrii]